MNKRVLMLSAAAAALLARPAFADDLTISTKTSSPVATATAANNSPGNITIENTGSIIVSQAGPAVTINSNNTVSNGGEIANDNTTNAQGVLIDTGNTGSFTNSGTIDLSGSGDTKTAISLSGTGTFTGPIALADTSVINITGNSSIGVSIPETATLAGDLDVGGTLTLNPTSVTSTTTALGVTGIEVDGNVNGNIAFDSTAVVTATGQDAQGLVVSGDVSGSISNLGTIQTIGIVESQNSNGTFTGPSTTSTNPEAGSAVVINGSVGGGIYNGGPASSSDATGAAIIATTGDAPTVLIGQDSSLSSPSPLTIGVYTADTTDPGYSFYNRGTISGASIDPNIGVTAIRIGGTSSAETTLAGLGFFNSGHITATAATNPNGGGSDATALEIDAYAVIGNSTAAGALPGIFNSNESGNGIISASLSGTKSGTATAISIAANATVQNIINQGTITATATTTDTTISSLTAYGILDKSGTVSNVNNSGIISAGVTQLDDNSQSAVALYLAVNTTGVTVTNTGTIAGGVDLGDGSDTFTVTGTNTTPAVVSGAIDFGTTPTGGVDKLAVNNFGLVTGAITEGLGGTLDVSVARLGTLDVTNPTTSLAARNFDVGMDGAGATLDLTVSSTLVNASGANVPVVTASNEATIADGTTVGIKFGSFIPESGQFILLQAPTGNLNISAAELKDIQGNVGTLPFLFESASVDEVTGATVDQLVFNVVPKTVAQLGLTGYAAQMFPHAAEALANDTALGAAFVNGVIDQTTAQTAFSQLAPDASGGTRAVAISLTDQATGPVADRQRTLRMYGNQPGDFTIWGQEFAQYLNDKGDHDLPGYKNRGFGFVMGADGGDPDDGWYGVAFSFYNGGINEQAPETTRTDSLWYMLTGYSDWRGKGFFLDTDLDVGYGDLQGHRFLDLGGVSREADAKRGSELVAGGFTTGAIFVYGSTTITPQASVDGLLMREEGYTEQNGGDGFDLQVQPYTTQSARGYLGVSLRQDINFGDFYLQPEGRIGYRYDFAADPIKLKTNFASVSDDQFTITGPDPERGNVVAGASLSTTTGTWSIGLNYDFVHGDNGSTTQVGTLSLVGRI